MIHIKVDHDVLQNYIYICTSMIVCFQEVRVK